MAPTVPGCGKRILTLTLKCEPKSTCRPKDTSACTQHPAPRSLLGGWAAPRGQPLSVCSVAAVPAAEPSQVCVVPYSRLSKALGPRSSNGQPSFTTLPLHGGCGFRGGGLTLVVSPVSLFRAGCLHFPPHLNCPSSAQASLVQLRPEQVPGQESASPPEEQAPRG